MRLLMSVGPPRSYQWMWWISQRWKGTSHSGAAHVRYMARSARRWVRLAVRMVRPASSTVPSLRMMTGVNDPVQNRRCTDDGGSSTPSPVSQTL